MREKKEKESLAMLKFATELHPKAAWVWNNLGSLQEDLGFKDEALGSSQKAVDLLEDDKGTELSFNQRIKRSSEARIKRLKGL
jgi:tetratricopeptide (TPR) repeat protein